MSDNLFLAPCFGDLSASQESNDSVALARQQIFPDKQSQTSISPLPDVASPIDAPNSPNITSEPLPSTICVDFAITDLENAPGDLSALAEPPINAPSSPILENSTPLPSAQSSQVLPALDKVDGLEHFDEELPKNDQDRLLPDEQLPFEHIASESTTSSPTECATNLIDFDASLADDLTSAGADLDDDEIGRTPQPESSDNTAEINSLDDHATFPDETVVDSSSTLDQDYVSSSPTSCPSDPFCFSSSPSLVSTATVPTSDMIIKDDEQEEEEELDLVAPTDIQLDNDCLPPSSPQISSSPPRILLDQEEEISEPERFALPDALLLGPEHEVSSDFDIQAVYTSSNEDEPLPSSPDRNFLPSHEFHISPPAATSPERLDTSRMVSFSSPPRPASKAQPSSPIMHQSSPIRLSSKQTMPTPKRPTALNHKRQFKKLSAPFRAPQMKLQEPLSSPVSLLLKQQKEESSDGQSMLPPPPPPPQDVKKRHRTIRASGQFRSPMVGASSVPSGPSVRMTPTIQLLERQVQILKRAVKVKNGGEEEELERLAKKWTEGGREVAWELWEAVKDNGSGSGSWDQPKNKRSFKDSWGWVEQGDGKKPKTENWGWDEKPEGDDNEEKQTASTGDDEGDEKVEFTMGLMLRQFGIDPETLGWNEEDGMFADL